MNPVKGWVFFLFVFFEQHLALSVEQGCLSLPCVAAAEGECGPTQRQTVPSPFRQFPSSELRTHTIQHRPAQAQFPDTFDCWQSLDHKK